MFANSTASTIKLLHTQFEDGTLEGFLSLTLLVMGKLVSFLLGLSGALLPLKRDGALDPSPVHLAVSPNCGSLHGVVSDVNAGIDPHNFKTIVSFGVRLLWAETNLPILISTRLVRIASQTVALMTGLRFYLQFSTLRIPKQVAVRPTALSGLKMSRTPRGHR